MHSLPTKGQSLFPANRSRSGLRWLVVAGIAAAAAGAWLLWPGGGVPADGTNAARPGERGEIRDDSAGRPRAATARRPVVVVLDEDPPAAAPRVVLPAPTIAELESRFRAERETDARSEIAAEIAGHNDAEAVGAIVRLFKTERNPAVKESLIAGLADIDPDAAPGERLAFLAAALRGQPRNVRSTALDLLAQSDDPRAAAMLAKTAAEDPDSEIRETARAILDALEAAENARGAAGQ